jgi:hypothetical protein
MAALAFTYLTAGLRGCRTRSIQCLQLFEIVRTDECAPACIRPVNQLLNADRATAIIRRVSLVGIRIAAGQQTVDWGARTRRRFS